MNKFAVLSLALMLSAPLHAHDERRPDQLSWSGHEPDSNWLAELLQQLSNPAYAAARIEIEGNYRVIQSDNTPDHVTGRFPNSGNPHRIRSYSKSFRVPLQPEYSSRSYPLGMWPFGVAINGVVFDPAAAEFWQNNPRSGWQYEALGGAVSLGLDRNNAHVQPDGTYHYHGMPNGLLQAGQHVKGPMLIGYAADGFPIYGPMGYSNPEKVDSALVKLTSSYQIRSGNRPDGPGGRYDGAFVQDYVFKAGSGDLDDCNGRFAVTPEYPQGSYHYVITDQFPFIPRCFHAEPDRSFMRGMDMNSVNKAGRHTENSREMRQPPAGGSAGMRRGMTPPQEAISACSGKTEGNSVSFTTPHGHRIQGICRQQNGVLFAVPPR